MLNPSIDIILDIIKLFLTWANIRIDYTYFLSNMTHINMKWKMHITHKKSFITHQYNLLQGGWSTCRIRIADFYQFTLCNLASVALIKPRPFYKSDIFRFSTERQITFTCSHKSNNSFFLQNRQLRHQDCLRCLFSI